MVLNVVDSALSWGASVDVDGARETDAELGVEPLPAKELEYIFERCPCTSRSALPT
jgi:hypothetical protein